MDILSLISRGKEAVFLEFAQICACGPSGYAYLKQKVDACARLGRSYEFAACRLPAHCQPAQAQLGFWRLEGDYLLYFRPGVSYSGASPRLRGFFQRGPVQRFSGFQAMVDCLRDLDRDLTGPPSAPANALFSQLRQELQSRVLGQDQAVEAAAFKLWVHLCKREPLRPLSLIFYGPTGVGKSELGKSIAPALNRCLGEERYRLVWTELNTFTQAHSVYRLTGAPPGYVGYDDAPVLEAVRRCPHSVFMFDELDKAHPEILKVFMSILDEGRCTARREDETGSRELDFRRCVFLFTTNTDLSAPAAQRLGFAPPAQRPAPPPFCGAPLSGPAGLARRLFQADESARQALIRAGVLGEIAGRFGGLIGFQPMTEQDRRSITARQIAALGREFGLEIVHVSPAIAQALTPALALSPRSSVPILEGSLTPVFLAHAPQAGQGIRFRLDGTPEHMVLIPA